MTDLQQKRPGILKNYVLIVISILLLFSCQKEELTQQEKDAKFNKIFDELAEQASESNKGENVILYQIQIDDEKSIEKTKNQSVNILDELTVEYDKIYGEEMPMDILTDFLAAVISRRKNKEKEND